MDINAALTAEFHLRPQQVENTVKLIDDGNTIPFIARYRKEMTGALDDQVLRELHERLLYLRNLDEQREKVRAVIQEQGALTSELEAALDAAATLTEIEDLYRPYRPKRKTRASVAKARGWPTRFTPRRRAAPIPWSWLPPISARRCPRPRPPSRVPRISWRR